MIGILIIACGKDNDDFTYPRKFSFKRSEIIKEKVFLIGDNESYSEVNPYKGYLDSLRAEFIVNYYHFIKDTLKGPFIESIELLSEDSIRLEVFYDDHIDFYTFPADVNNVNGEILDPTFFDATVVLNKEKQEIRICYAEVIGLLQNRPITLDQNYCTSNDLNSELNIFLSQDDYMKNDTLGIYILNLVYQ